MGILDDWHDSLRVLTVLMSLVCLYVLGYRKYLNSAHWNAKTRDYWYILVAWSVAAAALGVEGLFDNRPLEPRVVVYFMATLITVRGLLRDGLKGQENPDLFPHR